MEENKKPIAKGKAGGVDVAIWENKSKKQDGKDYQTISIQKSYKGKDDKDWKVTKILYASDLENTIAALLQAKTEAQAKGIKTSRN